MSRWNRGRLARPIASILAMMMLVTILVPLTALPLHAQNQMNEILKSLEKGIQEPTPLVVLEFSNDSSYKTGMLGRHFADAIAIEMTRTEIFEVVKSADINKVLEEYNLTMPLDVSAAALVADRVKAPFIITGTIEDVQIHKTREGTYAEVLVRSEVTSRITKTRINGAIIRQKSSPKIGYSGNPDMLVQEALSTAAYQSAQRLLDNRLPIGTILTSPRTGEVVIKGGSAIGFRKGMECVTVRRETVTGRLRLSVVNPTDCTGNILEESKGIAPGDKIVPIFEFEPPMSSGVRERTGLQIAGLLALLTLGAFIGHNGGDKPLTNSPQPSAASLADANFEEQPYGANLVTWPSRGDRVLAYIIYRDTSPSTPIAVVDGHTTSYVDSATPLPEIGQTLETVAVNVTIDTTVGNITAFTATPTFETTYDNADNPDMTISDTSYTVSARRIPLHDGSNIGYLIQTLFLGYKNTGLAGTIEHPGDYAMVLGNKSPVSNRVTLLHPPTLDSPTDGNFPTDGNYRCQRVTGASTYMLQLSPTASFTPGQVVSVTAYIEGDQYAVANYSLDNLYNNPILATAKGKDLYWRFAVKVDGQTDPVALSDARQNGWVYSPWFRFILPELPPRSIRSHVQGPATQIPNKLGGGSGRVDSNRSGALRRQ